MEGLMPLWTEYWIIGLIGCENLHGWDYTADAPIAAPTSNCNMYFGDGQTLGHSH